MAFAPGTYVHVRCGYGAMVTYDKRDDDWRIGTCCFSFKPSGLGGHECEVLVLYDDGLANTIVLDGSKIGMIYYSCTSARYEVVIPINTMNF